MSQNGLAYIPHCPRKTAFRFLIPLLLMTGACSTLAVEENAPPSLAGQLARFGLDARQAACVSGRLDQRLARGQMERLDEAMEADRDGGSVRDLMRLAATISDSQVGVELARAAGGCAALPDIAVRRVASTPAQRAAEGRDALWLNLGNAPTGQSIAVDASSLEQRETTRMAWFRLTNPGEAAPIGTDYQLRIDCRRRTLQSLARRRGDGGEPEAATEPAAPIEPGTVMEIAYLALCT